MGGGNPWIGRLVGSTQLQELRGRADNVMNIGELQALVEEVEIAMAQENRDWYWLMSFQDVRVRTA